MTTAFDDGAPRMRRFRSEWIGHYWIRLLIGYDLATAPVAFLPDGWSMRIANGVVVVPGALLFLHGMAHEVKLCEPCQAKMPLDPAGQAAKRARMLRATHWIFTPVGGRRISMSRGMLLFLALFLVVFALPSGPWWGLGSAAVDNGFFYSWIVMGRNHQRLQPWCPQCRWGDGGEEEPSPDPAPSRGRVPSVSV